MHDAYPEVSLRDQLQALKQRIHALKQVVAQGIPAFISASGSAASRSSKLAGADPSVAALAGLSSRLYKREALELRELLRQQEQLTVELTTQGSGGKLALMPQKASSHSPAGPQRNTDASLQSKFGVHAPFEKDINSRQRHADEMAASLIAEEETAASESKPTRRQRRKADRRQQQQSQHAAAMQSGKPVSDAAQEPREADRGANDGLADNNGAALAGPSTRQESQAVEAASAHDDSRPDAPHGKPKQHGTGSPGEVSQSGHDHVNVAESGPGSLRSPSILNGCTPDGNQVRAQLEQQMADASLEEFGSARSSTHPINVRTVSPAASTSREASSSAASRNGETDTGSASRRYDPGSAAVGLSQPLLKWERRRQQRQAKALAKHQQHAGQSINSAVSTQGTGPTGPTSTSHADRASSQPSTFSMDLRPQDPSGGQELQQHGGADAEAAAVVAMLRTAVEARDPDPLGKAIHATVRLLGTSSATSSISDLVRTSIQHPVAMLPHSALLRQCEYRPQLPWAVETVAAPMLHYSRRVATDQCCHFCFAGYTTDDLTYLNLPALVSMLNLSRNHTYPMSHFCVDSSKSRPQCSLHLTKGGIRVAATSAA